MSIECAFEGVVCPWKRKRKKQFLSPRINQMRFHQPKVWYGDQSKKWDEINE